MGTNEWTFFPLRGLTVVRTSGYVAKSDLNEWAVRFCMGAVTEFVLWDITQADISKLRANEICADEQNAVDLPELRKVSKAAIVSVNDLAYSLTNMLKALCGVDDIPFEVQVFGSFEDAKNWFGVHTNPDSSSPSHPPTNHEVLHR